MSDILKQIQALQEQFSNLLGENIFNAIDDYVKDPDKKEKLENKVHDIQQADDPGQKRFMEKNVHKISGHGKEYQKHNGPYTADYPNTGVYDGMDVNKTVDHLMNIAKSKAEDRYYKRCAKNRRFEKKMNDNNSYNEIISQIMDLKEAFSNLFEVEGLGEPSSEVPPSTNKLKKDIKTKDGKVQLVSVEDELFPKDGNKKEQFQQKVIDTINGMIQGTATLQDLLQIVRQPKKAPLKEAMELMEEMINEISDELANKVRAKREENADKAFWDEDNKFQKYAQARKDLREAPGYNFGMVDLGKALDAQKAKKEWEDSKKSKQEARAKMDKNRQLMHKREIRRSNKALEEAMEVLESIIQESSHKRKYGNPNAADGDTVGHTGTKYFKDGSKMHPHRVTKSNGYNGVDYAPHGTEYYDFDDKKVLQDAIKNGKDQPVGDDFKKIQKDLTNPSTKNDMYGKNLKWVANTLANRGKDYVSTVANTPKDTFTYIQGRMDKNKVKTDPTVLGRIDKTKKRIKSKMDKSEALGTWESAIKVLEGLFVKDGRGDLLKDVDDAIGAPVQRAVKGAVKQAVCPKKKEI